MPELNHQTQIQCLSCFSRPYSSDPMAAQKKVTRTPFSPGGRPPGRRTRRRDFPRRAAPLRSPTPRRATPSRRDAAPRAPPLAALLRCAALCCATPWLDSFRCRPLPALLRALVPVLPFKEEDDVRRRKRSHDQTCAGALPRLPASLTQEQMELVLLLVCPPSP